LDWTLRDVVPFIAVRAGLFQSCREFAIVGHRVINVMYDGGSLPGLKAGKKLRMYSEANQIRIMDGQTLVTTLVPSSVKEISYGQDVHRRVGAAIGLAVVSLRIGALMALTKKH